MDLICPHYKTKNLIVFWMKKGSEVNDKFYLRHLLYYNEIIYNHQELVLIERED